MAESLSTKLAEKTLDLREHLAAVRTILATERTFLSYQRTALTEFAAAATFVKFFDNPVLKLIGWLLVPVSIVTIMLGIYRYFRMKSLISEMDQEMGARCRLGPELRRQDRRWRE